MIRTKHGWHGKWTYHGKMTKWQELKANSLVRDGLTLPEAKQFVFYNFTNAYMRRFRYAIQHGYTGDLWELFRQYYDEAVLKGRKGKRGGYHPPPRRSSKSHKKLLPDGSVDKEYSKKYEQKRRAEAKQLPKGVTGVQRDFDGNIIGGVKYNTETRKYEEWRP